MLLGMSEELWVTVDEYFREKLIAPDAVLDAAREANKAGGLPEIDVSATQGKMLHLMARMCGARRILELGTLGGYSTIWLARALPEGGRLVTLEFEPKHAAVARENIARAGFAEIVEVRVGAAAESLAAMIAAGEAAFDLIFIDADKDNYAVYLEGALKLSRPGTVIVADNVVRDGAVIDPEDEDPRVVGVRSFFDRMAAEARLDATAIQTVGSKGYDGFALALVR